MAFHTQWPKARLHVANVERNRSGPYVPLDTRLLLSSQLYSLSCTVYGRWVRRSTWSNSEFRSEFTALKTCLLQSKTLRSLRLYVVEMYDGEIQSSWTIGPRNLDFQDGDEFPALEELTLPYDEYTLSATHCQKWTVTMDWRHLRHLDLAYGCPQHLLSAITGHVPRLKTLVFGFPYIYPDQALTWYCTDPGIVRRFFDSIEGLEEITATNSEAQPFDDLKDAILERHGRTLKKLHISFSASGVQGWDSTDVRKLVEYCPGLEDLALKIASVQDPTDGYWKWVRSFPLFLHSFVRASVVASFLSQKKADLVPTLA